MGWRPWFCAGCRKYHRVTVWIEGENHAGYWCLASMKRAHKAGRNDVPMHSEVQGVSAWEEFKRQKRAA